MAPVKTGIGKWRGAAALLALALCLASAVGGWRVFTQDLQYRRLVTEVGFWGRDGYTPSAEVLASTAHDLDALLVQAPRQPDYLSLRATVFAWQAHASADVDERIALGNKAMRAQYASLPSRPAHRHAWLKMVQYASRATTGATMLEQAQERLRLLGPGDIPVDAVRPRPVR